MSRETVLASQGHFDRAYSLLAEYIDICPENIWMGGKKRRLACLAADCAHGHGNGFFYIWVKIPGVVRNFYPYITSSYFRAIISTVAMAICSSSFVGIISTGILLSGVEMARAPALRVLFSASSSLTPKYSSP